MVRLPVPLRSAAPLAQEADFGASTWLRNENSSAAARTAAQKSSLYTVQLANSTD